MSMAELTIAQIQRHFLFYMILVHLLSIKQDKKVLFLVLEIWSSFLGFIPQPNINVVFKQLLLRNFTRGLLFLWG